MHTDAANPFNDENCTRKYINEAVSAEKQLWTLIHSRSPLDVDVLETHRKARSSYENTVLFDHEFAQLHDIEHALWRLHYKLIDEFRKRIQADAFSGDCIDLDTPHEAAVGKPKSDHLLEGFRTFLSEATEFYKELIEKIKKRNGLAKELSIFKEDCFSNFPMSTEMQRCQYLCHRCLVCLGDLARYNELYGNRDIQNRNWSVAANHYLSASILWPESGNAQNQMAVLAIYIGDELLTMYHCIRSLAVKEPFLNAWDNLILLFEKNRSSHLYPLSKETATFDFLKPSERIATQVNEASGIKQSNHKMPGASDDVVSSEGTCLWNLAVRMISFLFIKSSLEDFTSIFSSFVSELQALLSLDDSKLKAELESYQHIGRNAAIIGPLRMLQLVCALIFSVHSLGENQKLQRPKFLGEIDQPVSVELALTATLICIGRLMQRCAAASPVHHSPLLPAILVFLEWLVDWPDVVAIDEADEKYARAVVYFSSTFVDLLNRISESEGISNGSVSAAESPFYRSALWEDYELRGFAPIAPGHEPLYFTRGDDNGNHHHHHHARIHRIFVAAMKAADNSNGSVGIRKWICYEKSERKFYTAQSMKADLLDISPSGSMKENKLQADVKSSSKSTHQNTCGNSRHVEEEEEEIVFKPTVRISPAPLCVPVNANHELFVEGLHKQISASSGCGSSSLIRLHSNIAITNSNTCSKTPLANDSVSSPLFPSDLSTPFCFSGQTTTDSLRFGIMDNGTAGLPSQLDRAPSLSAWGLKRDNAEVAALGDALRVKNSSIRCIDGLGSDVKEISSEHLGSSLPINGAMERWHERELPTSKGNYVIGHGYTSSGIAAPPYLAPLPSAPPLSNLSEDGISSSCNGNDMMQHILATSTMLQDSMMDRKGMPGFIDASSPQVNNYFHSKWIRALQGPSMCDSGLPGYNRYTPPIFPAKVAADDGPWLHRQWDNFHQDRLHDLFWPVGRFHLPTHTGRFQDLDVSRFPAYDSWAMNYMDGPPLQPQVYDAGTQMMDRFHHGGYQGTSCYGHGGMVDEISERQLLLQYLKEKEWVLQQQGPTQLRGSS
ncbi:nonsense-mediated mRNA decay factor SMG7-like [Magnolia sinica]|uniref:nonsense-mediated mRNA decay factor SMG7-like n=1 Tax=Magnolia sinica TaxID=86752 RepID=UPI0026595306|nr:nonsense-mediated mRNA decay factor SMG7-like [Magnolia sinica]